MVDACTSLTILLGTGGGGPVVQGTSTEPSSGMGDGSMTSLAPSVIPFHVWGSLLQDSKIWMSLTLLCTWVGSELIECSILFGTFEGN